MRQDFLEETGLNTCPFFWLMFFSVGMLLFLVMAPVWVPLVIIEWLFKK
jgi:hypothetical protein